MVDKKSWRPQGEEDYNLQPWMWRTRYKMAPIYVALSILAFGFGLRLVPDVKNVWIGTLLTGGALSALVYARYGKGRKADKAMALFLYTIITVYLGLVLGIRLEWWPIEYSLGALAVAVLIFGAVWRADRRNQRTEAVEAELRRWPGEAKKIGLEKVRRGVTRRVGTGRRIRLWWNNGDATLDSVKAHARGLESILGIPYKKIRFIDIVDDDGLIQPNAVEVAEDTSSPISKAPVEFTEPTMRTVYDPLVAAQLEDGDQYEITIYDLKWGGKHTLVAGQTGSGKSGLYNCIFAESSKCKDLVRWGCDPKGGMTLQAWASIFDWFVTDQKGAEAQLTAIRDILDKRSKYAASKGWSVWRCSPKRPLIVLTIEECAEVFGPYSGIVDLANSIARMGRAAGVLLLLATQYPTADAISSSQLMQNIGRRFCFSVVNSLAQRIILPGSLEKVDATAIPTGPKHAGKCYTSEGGEIEERQMRVRYITEEQIRELVTEIGDDVSRLDRMSAEAAEAATEKFGEHSYVNRRIWLVEDLPPLDAPDDDDLDEDDEDDDEEPSLDDVHPAVRGEEPEATKREGEPVPDYPDDSERPSMKLSIAELAESMDQAERDRAIAEYLLEQRDDARVSPEEAQRRFDAALDGAGPDGVTAADLALISGRQKSWVYDQLGSQTMDEKVVPGDMRGTYRRAPGYRVPVGSGHAS